MAEFHMPSLGADMTSGILTEWLVKVGDRVHRGDVVAVVETDKGAIEIEIFVDGVVSDLVVPLDTEVPVGAVLAIIDGAAGATIARTAAPPAPVAPAPGQPRPLPPIAPAPAPSTPAPEATRHKISPAARKHARERGIDVERIVGTGHGGVVTIEDVERAAGAAQPSPTMPPKISPQARPATVTPPTAMAKVSDAMRRTIATAMSRSKREIPHYYLAHSIDLEPALRWCEAQNAKRALEQRLVYGALLLKATALALRDSPRLNGHWRENDFVAAERVDIGVVIALRGGGLVAPVLADAANRDLDASMAWLKDVTQRARSARLKSSELAAATITVSSLGDVGVETVLPVIHPPQVAIVGFGSVVTRPWVVDGGLFAHRIVHATLAGDHRASDGHTGARFLAALAKLLADPERL